jgi:citrate synthase
VSTLTKINLGASTVMDMWIGAEAAAERLGVKAKTLYAYVSRGTLTRRKTPDGRSVFNQAEIEELARRGRPRRQAGHTELVIESAVTMLGDDRHYYRGRDAIALAGIWRLEETAIWLWTGAEASYVAGAGAGYVAGAGPGTEVSYSAGAAANYPAGAAASYEAGAGAGYVAGAEASYLGGAGAATDVSYPAGVEVSYTAGARAGHGGDPEIWEPVPEALAAAREAQRGLAAEVLPLERLQVIVTALAVADPVRLNLDPAVVARTGQGLLAGMVDALPAIGPRRSGPRGLHERLWRKLAGARADDRLVHVLRFAMVLLADHELAASTLAARVAASVRADPYAVVTAGLGVTSGALHGGASLGVETLLGELTEPERAPYAMGERLRRGERLPGFGHVVYRNGDARGEALMDRLRLAVPGHPRLVAAEAVLAEAARRGLPAMNVDFPLALLTHLAGMPRGAGEAIFGIARTAGWLAHAMEEYAHPTRLRLRAAYTGPLA